VRQFNEKKFMTTSVCLSLLLSASPHLSAPPSNSESSAVHDWLEAHGQPSPSQQQIQSVFEQWQIWRTATPAAREGHLGAELMELAPESGETVHPWSQRERLHTLSAANLKRLQAQIIERFPVAKSASPEVMQAVRSMAENINFHYLRPYRPKRETGAHPPLPSPRELHRLNMNINPSFYSTLVGHSRSVGFSVVATKAGIAPYSLNAQIPHSALRLRDDFATENGFVLPEFSNAIELLSFFREWEPGWLEPLKQQSRYSLPHGIKTVDQFLSYLSPDRIQQVFPDASAYTRLALLRERLHRYVLSESDARRLLLWAFERYLLFQATENPAHFRHLQTEFRLPAGPQNIYAREFLTALGLPRLSLRVPLSVPSAAYSVLRIEPMAYNPFPDYGFKAQPRWDSRRLDHNSKP